MAGIIPNRHDRPDTRNPQLDRRLLSLFPSPPDLPETTTGTGSIRTSSGIGKRPSRAARRQACTGGAHMPCLRATSATDAPSRYVTKTMYAFTFFGPPPPPIRACNHLDTPGISFVVTVRTFASLCVAIHLTPSSLRVAIRSASNPRQRGRRAPAYTSPRMPQPTCAHFGCWQ